MKPKISVLIVDDSAIVRQALTEILSSDQEIEVIGVASDPFVAVNKMRKRKPDVIMLDVEMPRMDGITFLKKVMSQHPIPVVICSSMAGRGTDNAFKAMEYGAVEIVEKPQLATRQFLTESKVRICDAIKAAACARLRPIGLIKPLQPKYSADAVLAKPKHYTPIQTTDKVVVIGASTGGTEALRLFLEALPIDAPGMVVVQHMPENFTNAFARRLNTLCDVTVKEAENNDTVVRGRVLIAPGNRHTLLKRSGARYFVEVKEGPLVSRHRPSVDVLFRSAARYGGANVVGVIMTGMGDDGASGMREMKDAGAATIAQNEASCVVFGMPCEAIKRGGVDRVVSLERIASAALEECGYR